MRTVDYVQKLEIQIHMYKLYIYCLSLALGIAVDSGWQEQEAAQLGSTGASRKGALC